MVEIRGGKSAAFGVLVFGALLVVAGVLVALDESGPRVGGWLLIGWGTLSLIAAVRGIVSSAPAVRATKDGISFHGRAPVAWSRVKQIYPASMKYNFQGMSGRTATIAIDFIDRRTLLRLPPSIWLRSPFCVGDIDFGVANASVTASQLEALRVQAGGTDDARIIDSASIPEARIVQRDRAESREPGAE